MSPNQERVFLMLCRAAEDGEACPTNHHIAAALDASSPSRGPALLNQLTKLGFISVERGACNRVVTILETGKKTAGEVRQSHWRFRPENWHRRHILYTAPVCRRTNPEIVADKMAQPRVSRDPCTRCGIRGDIGCEHNCHERLSVMA